MTHWTSHRYLQGSVFTPMKLKTNTVSQRSHDAQSRKLEVSRGTVNKVRKKSSEQHLRLKPQRGRAATQLRNIDTFLRNVLFESIKICFNWHFVLFVEQHNTTRRGTSRSKLKTPSDLQNYFYLFVCFVARPSDGNLAVSRYNDTDDNIHGSISPE